MTAELRKRIFNIKTEEEFWVTARGIFDYQKSNNKVYREFVSLLGRERGTIGSFGDIHFLPVEFFRNHKILAGEKPVETIFESSGTTGVIPGKHYVSELKLYEESFTTGFNLFYGNPADYLIIALLPSYTERERSSLVYMADKLIKKSRSPLSGFYKDSPESIYNAVRAGKKEGIRILLLGVSFALLDLAESESPDLSGVIVMETGGMKGRRKELTRAELHRLLCEKLNVTSVHSEYGMTELMSQAYSSGNGVFYCPPWMKIIIRDPQDPLSVYDKPGKTGGINIIDLANINSCPFIATGDLGKLHDDGGFEVLGRFDNSDIRGCNLMAE
jgi:phenylacetate-coenzyme A ligase PaaK-like adenylate-forming protein